MKSVVLAAALIAGFAQQPTKPASNSATGKTAPSPLPTSAKKAAASSLPSVPVEAVTPDTQLVSTAPATQDVWGQNARLGWFIEGLAVVAALQFFTLLWQAISIRKLLQGVTSHAQNMEYQSRVLDGLLKASTEQLAALQDTAASAKASAEAAKENVGLIASKERARLRIELQPFFLNYDAPSPASFTIQHMGSTDAFVVNSRAAIYVSDSKDPDPIIGNGKPLPIPSVISAKDPVVVAQDVLHLFSTQEIDNIRQLKSFVHFTGFIRYKDVFDAEHETRFNRVWSIAKMNHLNGEPFTYWELCGSPAENIET